jgi:hypothetical protein
MSSRRSTRVLLGATAAVTLVVPSLAAIQAAPASAAPAASSSTRQVSAAGRASFTTSASPGTATGVEAYEFPGAIGGDAAGDGGGTDRSHSKPSSGVPVGAVAQPAPVTASTPGLLTSFAGLNHFDNRFGTGPNQFSLEPPDQGLCVGSDGHGNARVLEAVNDVVRVFTTSGTAVTPPVALNPFFGYAPAINRSTGTFGPFVTDPSCLYDEQTGRWFLDVLTIDTYPQPGADGLQHFTGTNHLDLAVSQTSDPLGPWTIYRVPVQDDGTNGTPDHGCAPNTDPTPPVPSNPNACLGDYPHIGSDANGIYITTNEYSLFGIDFHGAQVYAFSKAALAAGVPSLAVTQFDTHGLDTFGSARNGFTLWPSTTPGGGGDPAAGGTEYFLSSTAAAEARDPGDGSSTSQPSNQLLTWALTNTLSLNGTPTLTLSVSENDVGSYAPPPLATQKSGSQPLRQCLNNNSCSTFLEGIKDPYAETSASLDAGDSRMQQVTWVNGRLWGALDTALKVSSGKQAGIEWFAVAPTSAPGALFTTLVNSGYLGLGNDNLSYPALGMTASGTGVMGFTVLGANYYPSAGYVTMTADGPSAVHVAAAGAGPDDGFSNYKLFGNPPGTVRARWGDYGAAVPVGGNVWIASELIDQTCSFATWQATNFRCGNTRTALANWSTRISQVTAP